MNMQANWKGVLAIGLLLIAGTVAADAPFDNLEELSALIDQCENIRHGQPGEAIELINPLIEHIDAEQFPYQRIRAIGCRTQALGSLGRNSEVDQNVIEMEQLMGSLEQPQELIGSLHFIYRIRHRQDKTVETIEAIRQALEIAEENGFQTDLIQIYTYMGIMHSEAKNHELAIEHYLKALDLIDEETNPRAQLPVLYNLGLNYRSAGRLDEAVNTFEQLLEPLAAPGMEIRLASLLAVLASIRKDQGELDEAESYFQRSATLHENLNNPAERAALLIDLGYLALEKNDIESALNYSETALNTAREADYSMSIRGALEVRARAMEEAGMADEAVQLLREYNVLNEEHLKDQQRSALNEIQAQLGFEQQAVELAELRAQQQQQSYELGQQKLRQTTGIIIGVLILAGALTAFFWQRRTNRRLTTLSQTDQLTGLANRRRIMDFLSGTIEPNNAESYVLMLLDLDYFKQINDIHGHDAGDRTLIQVASQLRAFAQTHDAELGRWGGEEFLILFMAHSAEQASHLAGELLDRVASIQPETRSDTELKVTASAGFVPIGSMKQSPDQRIWEPALLAADQLLYRAKKAGRNGFFGVWPMAEGAKIEAHALDAALESGEFQLLHKTV